MARRAGTWSAANATRPQRPSASLGVTASLTDRLVIKFVTYSELSVAFARLEELERVITEASLTLEGIPREALFLPVRRSWTIDGDRVRSNWIVSPSELPEVEWAPCC